VSRARREEPSDIKPSKGCDRVHAALWRCAVDGKLVDAHVVELFLEALASLE
jgi:hypothetical protein